MEFDPFFTASTASNHNFNFSIERDPLCNKLISSLFIKFATDYFRSFEIGSVHENSVWISQAQSFLETSFAIQFIRDLTKLFLSNSSVRDKKTNYYLDNSGRLVHSNPEPFNFNFQQVKTNPTNQPVNDVHNSDEQLFLTREIANTELNTSNTQSSPVKKPRSFRCTFPGCGLKASFNVSGIKRAIFCFSHRSEGMVNVSSKKCIFEGCTVQAKFNFRGQFARFCASHKVDGMINVYEKVCSYEGCPTIPNFNFPGSKSTSLFCAKHKAEGMVAVVNRNRKRTTQEHAGNFCQEKGCSNKTRQLSHKGRYPLYCKEHKVTNLKPRIGKNRKCEHPSCDKTPSFNFRHLRRARFCNVHRMEGMIKVALPICISAQCNLYACFGFEDLDVAGPSHCIRHKLEGMIRLGSTCNHPDCEAPPRYNVKGEQSGKFCSEHKQPEMVRILSNVTQKRCKFPGCNVETGTRFCLNHQEHDTSTGHNFCKQTSCKKLAYFSYRDDVGEGKFCFEHKHEGMVKQRVCII